VAFRPSTTRYCPGARGDRRGCRASATRAREGNGRPRSMISGPTLAAKNSTASQPRSNGSPSTAVSRSNSSLGFGDRSPQQLQASIDCSRGQCRLACLELSPGYRHGADSRLTCGRCHLQRSTMHGCARAATSSADWLTTTLPASLSLRRPSGTLVISRNWHRRTELHESLHTGPLLVFNIDSTTKRDKA
jgi:hypothetical protein